MEHSFKELQFLDTLIKNQNGQIITNIYDKATDIRRYLHLKRNNKEKMEMIKCR